MTKKRMHEGIKKISERSTKKTFAMIKNILGTLFFKQFIRSIKRMFEKIKPIITISKMMNSLMYPKVQTATSTESRFILFQKE
jgi:hypothetical protein